MLKNFLYEFQNFVSIILIKLKIKRVIHLQYFQHVKFYASSGTEIFRTWKYGGEHSPLGAFLFLLKDDDVVWDIGASIGLFSVYSAYKSNHVVAFEPEPAIFKRLQENLALNDLTGKVQALNIGLSSEKGDLEMNSDGIEGMSPSIRDIKRHTSSVKIKLDKIDNLVQNNKIKKPSVLKIDIEGAEIQALKGAVDFLSSANKPRLIFIEVHPTFIGFFGDEEEEIYAILNNAGYRILSNQMRDDQYHLIANRI